MRATIAYVISSIASWDWPDDWPELFDILMSALASSDTDAVHGSMRVLTGEPSTSNIHMYLCIFVTFDTKTGEVSPGAVFSVKYT